MSTIKNLNLLLERICEDAPTEYIDRSVLVRELYIIYRLARDHKFNFEQISQLKKLSRSIGFLKNQLKMALRALSDTTQYLLHASVFTIDNLSILNYYILNDFCLKNPLNINTKTPREFYYDSLITSINRYFTDQLGTRTVETISTSHANSFSSRYNIYSRSIRMSQIQSICDTSDRLRQIYNNLKYISDDLTSNELQRLYSTLVQGDTTDDLKLLVLKFNMDTEQMAALRLRMPLIYKLLRAARVGAKDTHFTQYEKLLIRDVIKENVHSRLTQFLSSMNSAIISEAIAIKIESAITEGEFLDPYSLAPIKIKGSLFIEQLVEYIRLVVQNVEREPCC